MSAPKSTKLFIVDILKHPVSFDAAFYICSGVYASSRRKNGDGRNVGQGDRWVTEVRDTVTVIGGVKTLI